MSRPLIYPSQAEAQFELQEFLREIAEEIAYGERDPDNGYDAEEFRVVEVADPADI